MGDLSLEYLLTEERPQASEETLREENKAVRKLLERTQNIASESCVQFKNAALENVNSAHTVAKMQEQLGQAQLVIQNLEEDGGGGKATSGGAAKLKKCLNAIKDAQETAV